MNQQKLANIDLIQNALRLRKLNVKALFKLHHQAAKKFQTAYASNIALFQTYQKLLKTKKIKPNEQLAYLLRTKPIRNLSGVAVVAVLTKPYPCPGKCLFCPTQKNIPKSYLKNEPAVMRAVSNQFDPFRQVKRRIQALQLNGYNTEKVELIVIGGTFSALPHHYQTWFIKSCLDALNNKIARNFIDAKRLNEKAPNRCIGLTLETRPDFINLKEIKRMRYLGATRVEIGVQCINNQILQFNQRGHQVEDTIQATQLLKNAGFKVCYHLMPNLPKSNPAQDFQMFQKIFTDPHFQPDQIKIYPCVVTKESQLYSLWKQNQYHPYSPKTLEDLIVKIKKIIPPYIRIIRLVRDIPATEIVAGNKISNLRETLKKHQIRCQCIRCREAKGKTINQKNLSFSQIEYQTIGGKEIFLQYTSQDKQTLFAFLRLRLPTDSPKQCLKSIKNMALIRELHTYGLVAPLKKAVKIKRAQHHGLGKALIKKAELITKKSNYQKIAVISGIGVRDYYRQLGYQMRGQAEYLIKKLK